MVFVENRKFIKLYISYIYNSFTVVLYVYLGLYADFCMFLVISYPPQMNDYVLSH